MCAAKLERTGFVLRNLWPNVKQFANEQSANLAQSANESSFVRKNSKKAESATTGTRQCSRRSGALQQRRFTTHHLSADALGTIRHRHPLITASYSGAPHTFSPCVAPNHIDHESLPVALRREKGPALLKEERSHSGVSIEELIQTASEKFSLNPEFWGKYQDIPAMAQASDKHDILQIIENFVIIHRKHVYLFQRLKNTVLRKLDMWSAPDLAVLCHAWAQLGFLHEDLCVAMASRITATAHACTAQQLCWLMDAYATARCSIQSVTDMITKHTLLQLDTFSYSQLCLHASSFARLNIPHRQLFEFIAERLVLACPSRGAPEDTNVQNGCLTARDLTLAAYSFAKLGFFFDTVFEAIAKEAFGKIRDFTARDLQMLVVAFAKAQHRNSELLIAISHQAQRRIAQFSAESLALMLRSMSLLEIEDYSLFSRAVAQLPRAIPTFRPADVTTMLKAFAAVQFHSLGFFDVITPFILEKASMFTPSDWISALQGYSSLGHKDILFLSAVGLHLEVPKLTPHQLCSAVVDCSRLSFTDCVGSLIEAAGGIAFEADAAAQMYSAILLLGYASDTRHEHELSNFLTQLAAQLHHGSAISALSLTSCINLCYATLLVPPVRGTGHLRSASHPVDTHLLIERVIKEAQGLTSNEIALTQLILRALQLLPWNRCALRSASRLEAVIPTMLPEYENIPAPQYFAAAAGQLAPIHPEDVSKRSSRPAEPHCTNSAGSTHCNDTNFSDQNHERLRVHARRWHGIFVAHEISNALYEMSLALSSCGIEHHVILDPDTEPHLSIPITSPLFALEHILPGQRSVAMLWGSTVHYVHNPRSKAHDHLKPAALLQITLLRELRKTEVVVVPHWWWPRQGLVEEKGRALMQLLSDASKKGAVFPDVYQSDQTEGPMPSPT